MEFKGTKGKWEKVTADWDLNQSVFLEDTEEIICDVKSLSPYAIYDALLISKAPEMLELLQSLVSSEMTPLVIRKQAKQLIKEATTLEV